MVNKNTRIALQLLARLDQQVVPKVKENEEIVNTFMEALQQKFTSLPPENLFHGAQIMHGGSAYEGLSVSEKTDFDVIIVLNKPYVMENFKVSRDPSKFFTLKWNEVRGPADREGYLDAAALQEQLFDKLSRYIESADLRRMRGVNKIQLRTGLASLDLQMFTNDGNVISVDVAPQITVRSWNGNPDLKPLHNLPATLRRHIAILEANSSPVYFFTPAVSGRQRHQHRLCNISFSMLEKQFLKSNLKIRDMVRLVKLVAIACDWKKKFVLKSFLVKRVAVKYADNLQQQTVWGGFKDLMKYISAELQTGTIDGFFVINQVIYQKKPEKIAEFRAALAMANKWTVQDVERMVS